MESDFQNDSEIENFFKELEESNILSADALKEIRSDLDVSNKSIGLLKVEKTIIEEAKEPEQDLRARLADMSIAEKIKLALLGDAVCRSLLIVDTSRLIQQAVLQNPRMQPTEVESFAKNPNVSDYVLRSISSNRNWMKSYLTKLNIVSNPKCPNDVGLKWLRHLNKNDLRKLAKSKNVPQLIAVTARRILADEEK
jgi:hypothetical protein